MNIINKPLTDIPAPPPTRIPQTSQGPHSRQIARMKFSTFWGLLAAAVFCCAAAQLPDCSQSGTPSIPTPTTMMESINMTCSVSPSAVVDVSEQYIWEWFRLAPDNSVEERITDGITSSHDVSLYILPAQCESSGIYQAFYYSAADNTTCLFSCFFPIEVEETRPDILREDFSSLYPMVNDSMVPVGQVAESQREPGTMQTIGICGDEFYLSSTCVVRVQPTWYRNGSRFNHRADDNYLLLGSGELRILNLTEATVGYYACVLSVNALGGESYQTQKENITLALPTDTPPTTSPPSTARTTDVLAVPESLFGTLKAWQFGIIIGVAALAIIVVLVSGMVWMARLTVKRRKTNRRQRRGKRLHARDIGQRAPRSLMEEIQMTDAENVDFGVSDVSSGPVEVPFNCILFEELLHKGTFKVVHHGIVNHPAQGVLGAEVAVKRLKDEKSELGYEELMNEAVMLRTMQEKAGSHPNIVSLLGLTTQGGPTCLLLDYVPNGTLEEFLVSLGQGPIPEWYMKFVRDTLRGAYHKHVSGDLMNIVVQVAEGMKFLTDEGFLHQDLSVRNVLMGERLNVKISNPGMQHEGYYYIVSEREHFFQDMAPECLWEKHYSVSSDVWSYGILVYRTVALNATPFPNMEVDQLHGRMVGGERPQLLASFSNEMYFLLQRCWQFVATERPSFSTVCSDLAHMAEKPTRHILLKAMKDHTKPGHISENGQVFLRGLPPHALEEGEVPKKAQRSSGTMRSLISSIDDTIYTRETAETVLDLTQSETENENYNNYERYLKGDPAAVLLGKAAHRQSYDETDSGNDASTKKVKPVSRKSSKTHHHEPVDGDDTTLSPGKSSGTSSLKKKKRRSAGGGGGKAVKAAIVYANKGFGLTDSPGDNGIEGSGELSSDGAPSMTEEEDDDKRATSELSGSDLEGSQAELVRL